MLLLRFQEESQGLLEPRNPEVQPTADARHKQVQGKARGGQDFLSAPGPGRSGQPGVEQRVKRRGGCRAQSGQNENLPRSPRGHRHNPDVGAAYPAAGSQRKRIPRPAAGLSRKSGSLGAVGEAPHHLAARCGERRGRNGRPTASAGPGTLGGPCRRSLWGKCHTSWPANGL